MRLRLRRPPPSAAGTESQAALLAKADHTEEEEAEPTEVEASETVEALDESFLLRLPGCFVDCSSTPAKPLASQPGSSPCRAASRSHTSRNQFARVSPKVVSTKDSFMLTQPLCSLASAPPAAPEWAETMAFFDATKPSFRYKLDAATFLSATNRCKSLHLKLGHLLSVNCKALASSRVATPRFWCLRLTLMWEMTMCPMFAAALSLLRVWCFCSSALGSSSSSLAPLHTLK
mmetsp:Transcript_66942/g.185393  ORF Transcript_66942/g.185393 Transcript_66942/m.185393 type:complete len:232 (+) Transcript_66942:227-922(+)